MSDGPDKTIYRTTDPRMTSLWAKWNAEKDEYVTQRDAFLAEYAPEGCALMLSSGFGGARPLGVSVEGWSEKVPDGWRLDRKHWVLVPFKKTAQGKRIAVALATLKRRDQRADLVGMPSFLMDGFAWHQPGIEIHDDAMFVIWSDGGPPADEIDSTVWERVRLSEWYALIEDEAARPNVGEEVGI